MHNCDGNIFKCMEISDERRKYLESLARRIGTQLIFTDRTHICEIMKEVLKCDDLSEAEMLVLYEMIRHSFQKTGEVLKKLSEGRTKTLFEDDKIKISAIDLR